MNILPFRYTGPEQLLTPKSSAGLVALGLLLGTVLARGGILAVAGLIMLPFAGVFLAALFNNPRLGLASLVLWGFLGQGTARYVEYYSGGGAVMGLGIDVLLLLTFIALFLNRFQTLSFSRLKSPLLVMLAGWLALNVFELFNPEAPGLAAWFYASRGVVLYLFVAVPLGLLLFDGEKDLDMFLKLWFTLSLMGTLWGIRQKLVGLDQAEQLWLSDPGNYTTHLLFGQLRIFSFYTDAGQFGAAQGHTAVSAAILALNRGKWIHRGLYAIVALVSMVGLIISGTRGALAVPVAGFAMYLLLSKNWKVLLIGAALLAAGYVFLKFTYIGQDVYEIRRLRTALDPNDASFQARLINQRKLGDYLASRPFGGGVGSAGFWGQRFKPGSFLATVPTDSWYVRIWVEYGIVGLIYYLIMLTGIIGLGVLRVIQTKNPALRQKLAALLCGLVGIAAASYGNQVWGQMPTGIIISFSIALIFLPRRDVLPRHAS